MDSNPDAQLPFSPEPPTPARIVFEYAAAEIKRREILVERCLSMALYWRQRAEFAYERLQTAITVAEDAARACGKTGNQP